MAGRGLAGPGEAGPGKAWPGKAGIEAGYGEAGYGEAGCGQARQGRSTIHTAIGGRTLIEGHNPNTLAARAGDAARKKEGVPAAQARANRCRDTPPGQPPAVSRTTPNRGAEALENSHVELQKFWTNLHNDSCGNIRAIAVRIAMAPYGQHAALAEQLQSDDNFIIQEIGKSLAAIADGARCAQQYSTPRAERREAGRVSPDARHGQRKPLTENSAHHKGPYDRRQAAPRVRDKGDEGYRLSTDWPAMIGALRKSGFGPLQIADGVDVCRASISDYEKRRIRPRAEVATRLIAFAARHGIERIATQIESEP